MFAQENRPTGLAFSNDGLRMFVIGFSGNEIHQYDLALADVIPPTLAIQDAPSTVNNTTAFSVTFEFSEDITGFAVTDIMVGNGTASNFSMTDANTYTADISPNSSGDITIDVATAVAQDLAGNDNTAATQVTVIFDNSAPTTTSFVRQTPSDPLTNADMLTFLVTFSEDVQNVDNAYVFVQAYRLV